MVEESKPIKLFWKPVDGGEFKELEGVTKVEGLDPLEEPVENAFTPKEYSLSCDIEITPTEFRSIRKLFKCRLPRKFKKTIQEYDGETFGYKAKQIEV